MAQFSNSFAVSGIIVKDANVRKFEKSSVARFGLSVMAKDERAERGYISAIINCEAWRKADNAWSLDQLKKGAQLTLFGFFKPLEWTDAESGTVRNSVVLCVTKIEKTEKTAKADAAAETSCDCDCASECVAAPVDDLPF